MTPYRSRSSSSLRRSGYSVLASLTCAAGLLAQTPLGAAAAPAPAAATPAAVQLAPLDQPVLYFSQDAQPVQRVLQALGRAVGVSVISDPDVAGEVNVEFHNSTVRGVLDGICHPYGLFWEETPQGWITVHRFKTILYQISGREEEPKKIP